MTFEKRVWCLIEKPNRLFSIQRTPFSSSQAFYTIVLTKYCSVRVDTYLLKNCEFGTIKKKKDF